VFYSHQMLLELTPCFVSTCFSVDDVLSCTSKNEERRKVEYAYYFWKYADVNRSPHRHSSRCWLEAPAGSSTEKLAAASGSIRWPICWCCLDRGPGSFDVEDATTLSWSSAAVSEWVSECWCCLVKIIKISQCLLKLQLAKVGTFFWDTVYVAWFCLNVC